MADRTPTPKKLEPTPRQLQAADPRSSIWVSANAGSGKTHVLVERVIRLLLAGADPAAILCITYTKAAAAEMSARLFKRLGEWAAWPDARLTEELKALQVARVDKAMLARARSLFTATLETPGGLKIQTIHAFCERLLHLFPVEAGIAPGFSVMDERETRDLQDRAIALVLEAAENGAAPHLAESFTTLATDLGEEQFQSLIRDFVASLRKWNRGGLALTRINYETLLRQVLGLDVAATEASALHQLAAIDAPAYASHAERLKPHGAYRGTNTSAALLDIVKAEDPCKLLAKFFLTDAGTPRANLIATAVRALLPETDEFLAREQARVHAASLRCTTLKAISRSADALVLAAAIHAHIEAEKRRIGKYDFDDLIGRAARLLSDRESTQWVLRKLDSGITHILLDEAQDTGPGQWQMIEALAQEFFAGSGANPNAPRTLFVVGDRKQSIYSFQGADVSAYGRARDTYVGRNWLEEVDLSISYRSTAEVLRAVDTIFTESTHQAARLDAPGRVEIIPPIAADAAPEDDPWTPVDREPQNSAPRKLAREIAQRIAGWLNPARPRKLTGSERAVTAGDILILFRSRGPFFNMVLAELRAHKVPVAGADRLDLLQSLIVQDLIMLLQWLLLPGDDHALAVILKSPLMPEPIEEPELFALAYGRKEQPLHDRLTGANRAWLEGLRDMAAGETPFALLSHVLNRSRKRIMRRLGNEAVEASDAMLDLSLDHEREYGPSLFGFLRWFSSTETTIRRELGQSAGEVRMMTVHGAKGLEAPVVIIADAKAAGGGAKNLPRVITVPEGVLGSGAPVWLPSGLSPFLPQLQAWSDARKAHGEAENERLLYVAMTRAADELYVYGYLRQKDSGIPWWKLLAPLNPPDDGAPLRFGPDDEILDPQKKPGSAAAVIPSWIGIAVFASSPAKPVAVTSLSGAKDYDSAAARRGRAMHRLLEELADVPADQRVRLAQKRGPKLGLPDSDVLSVSNAFISTPMAPYLTALSRSEVDIAGELPDGREVSGRIDRLTVTPEGIWLLDWKTDRYVPESLLQDHDYARQMAGYVALLKAAYPGRPVTAAIFWTEQARLDILPDLHTRDSAHT